MPSINIQIILDDESYFILDGSDFYGNDHYYYYHGLEVPKRVDYRPVTKFAAKIMAWVAISSRGISN